MRDFLVYMVETGMCLGVVLLIYKLFMRSTTFFKFNRIYLIAGVIISFTLPAIPLTYNIVEVKTPTIIHPVEIGEDTPLLSHNVSQVEVNYAQEAPVITSHIKNNILIKMDNVWIILFVVYISGVLLLLARNIIAHIKLVRICNSGKKNSYDGYKLIDSPKVVSPFTVFNTIFVNLDKMSEESKTSILKHETIHLRQCHWLDLTFSELMLILQWFNPISWLYVRSQKENHEYLADKGALEQGISPTLYRAILLNESFQGKVFNFANAFKNSGSLGRLAMMKKEKSSAWKRVFALAIVPLFGVFLWLSAEPNYLLFNLDSLSLQVIDKVKMVDKDGYPVENGVSSKDVLDVVKIAGYENVIPSSLRNKSLGLYSKRGTDGTLVVKTHTVGGKGIANSDMIDRIKNLEDVIILIDGKAVEIDSLLAMSLHDIDYLSFIHNDRMISQEGEEMTVSLLSGFGRNTPKIIKTDNMAIAESPNIFETIEQLSNVKVIVDGKPKSIRFFRNINPGNINILTVFTKPKKVSYYGGGIDTQGVVIVKTDGSPS